MTQVRIPRHGWTHLVTILDVLPAYEKQGLRVVAETREISGRKSGYRAPVTRTLRLTGVRGVSSVPSIGTLTAAVISDDHAELRHPALSIDKISLRIAMDDEEGMQMLFNLFVCTLKDTAFHEEHGARMSLRMNDGLIQVKKSYGNTSFIYGSIVSELTLPQSLISSLQGKQLSEIVDHESIGPDAVAIHVIAKDDNIHIEYAVQSHTLDEVFGSLEQYLHHPRGSTVMLKDFAL